MSASALAVPTSVGGDAVSAPDFTMDDDTDSELEVFDGSLPLNTIPVRAPDGTVESHDMVEYKDACQFVNSEHAKAQMNFKFQHRITKRELRVLAECILHGEIGIPLNSTAQVTAQLVQLMKPKKSLPS